MEEKTPGGAWPERTVYKHFVDAAGKDLEIIADEVQNQYRHAVREAVSVALVEEVARASPYAALAMLENMSLADPTKMAAYLAVAQRADNKDVDALLRRYCLRNAGFPETQAEPGYASGNADGKEKA